MSAASSGWPVLWLSANAVQLTAPIGDDGQLMSGASGGSCGWPVLRLSTNALLQTFPFLFCSSFPLVRLFRSYSFLFSALQTFPLVLRSSFPFFFALVTF